MWKGRGWSPVSNHGSPWWSGKDNDKGWRTLAFQWLPLHEYSIGLVSVLLEIKVIFITKVTIFPYCLAEITNMYFLLLTESAEIYIDKIDLWIADTGCLQECKWNQKCQSCVLHTWHQIAGGSHSSPVLSVQSQSSLLVNRRWHGREYFPIETNFSGFISFLDGTKSCKFCIDFSITCNFKGSWEEMLGYLPQELYIHRFTHKYVWCI